MVLAREWMESWQQGRRERLRGACMSRSKLEEGSYRVGPKREPQAMTILCRRSFTMQMPPPSLLPPDPKNLRISPLRVDASTQAE